MLDAEPDGRVDVQGGEVVAGDPVDLAGLVARAQFAPQQLGAEADRELLADLAVGVRDDVGGVGVDADDGGGLDVDAGLFLDLAHHGVADGLADVLGPAGDGVEVVVRAPDHE